MTDLQKSIYADMKSSDRVLAWLIKAEELNEFSSFLAREDVLLLCSALKKAEQRITFGDTPTIDPKSIQERGRWIHKKNWDKYVCSMCSNEEDRARRFCPECGARMDLEG